jgi:primosomal protein N' (replication factor Y)
MEQVHHYLISPASYLGTAGELTYHSSTELAPGAIVEVPVGRRKVVGVVMAGVGRPEFATKAILRTFDLPPLPADLPELARWMAAYYAAPLSSSWGVMLPAGLGRKRRAREAAARPSPAVWPPSALTGEQKSAIEKISTSQATSHLIQGVTGSGKTRVYLELAAASLAQGRSVIVLVPEIVLTPQIVSQFEAAFGDSVIASHSKLTEAERDHAWQAALAASSRGVPRIVVGPRSCLFMPAADLGLIVIDECHESTYKQEQHLRYHALPTAAKRAHLNGAKLVLGSATPGLTEVHLAAIGRIEYLNLNQRVNLISPPQGKIIDLRDKSLLASSKFITQPLLEAVSTTVAAKRQALLYINRRGSASSQVCSDCGHVTTCPNCQLPLTFHADLMRLICHHCNYRMASPAVCPNCNGADLRLLGGGTKRIEDEISRLLPSARIARLDRDSATLPHIQAVYAGLKSGQIDIVIGTQMIAKGLDLPAVDTIGIVNADTMLYLPDFTAAERTFQLLHQVSGRAGRGDRPGEVFIQTYSCEHPAILAAAGGNFDSFAGPELEARRLHGYPPFVFLLKLVTQAATPSAAQEQAAKLATQIASRPGLQAIGPAPAFIELQAGRYRWVITVKSKRRAALVEVAASLPTKNWTADLDPINLL